MKRLRNEAGQSAIEFALLVPIVIAVVLLIVVGSRLVSARGGLVATAQQAARAAVEAPPPGAADVAGRVGREVAAGYGLAPDHLELVAGGELTRGGTYAVVARYRVSMAPMPGSLTLEVRHTEPVDPFRSGSFGG